MEAILRELFDMQRFVRDPVLQSVIDEVEARYADKLREYADKGEISMRELESVAAAGEPPAQYPDPCREKELW